MKITKSIRIEASADRVWEVLGPNYDRAGDWASAVYVSRARPGEPKAAGAPYAGRLCETSLGGITETIEYYDPKGRRLSYSATGDKMPGFLRSLVNRWSIEPTGPGSSQVVMEMTADIKPPFNLLMGWMMRMQFNKVLSQSIEEFKHFVETGTPHPRKVKANRSKKAVAARQLAAA